MLKRVEIMPLHADTARELAGMEPEDGLIPCENQTISRIVSPIIQTMTDKLNSILKLNSIIKYLYPQSVSNTWNNILGSTICLYQRWVPCEPLSAIELDLSDYNKLPSFPPLGLCC